MLFLLFVVSEFYYDVFEIKIGHDYYKYPEEAAVNTQTFLI